LNLGATLTPGGTIALNALPSGEVKQVNLDDLKDASKKKPNNTTGADKRTDPCGAKEQPLVVDTLGHQQTPIERQEGQKQAAKAEAEEQYHRSVDRWTLTWYAITAISATLLLAVGVGGVIGLSMTKRGG
jgi:hypothetical protein